MPTRKSTKRFAICINNSEYPASLDMYKVYRVLPDEKAEKHGDIRVIDESGEDYLFPTDYFVLIEPPIHIARILNKAYTRQYSPAR
jgi:hypothetical protein